MTFIYLPRTSIRQKQRLVDLSAANIMSKDQVDRWQYHLTFLDTKLYCRQIKFDLQIAFYCQRNIIIFSLVEMEIF